MEEKPSAGERKNLWTGTASSAAAFVSWGLLTLFWKLFEGIPVFELFAHRILWSFLTCLVILAFRKRLRLIKTVFRDRRTALLMVFATLAIGGNWLIYIYAMISDNVVQASLGYYINPLVSILLGVVVLREKIGFWQILSIALAVAGVIIMTFSSGAFPWIAVSLSMAFGFYGLVKKVVSLDSDVSLALEVLSLCLFSAAYFIVHGIRGTIAFFTLSPGTIALVLSIGPATIIPLLLFNVAARRIPLSRVGFMQFITPTIMLVLGVLLYGERFTRLHLYSFMFIWAAVILFLLSRSGLLSPRGPKSREPKNS